MADAAKVALKFLNQRSPRHLQKLRGNTWKATKWQRKPDINRWDIVKGDKVEVVNGPEKGKQGLVLKVVRKRNSLLVEGINMKKRIIPATQEYRGAMVTQESLLHYSRVQLVDPTTGKRTRVQRKFQEGEKVRVATATGVIIPKPDSLKKMSRPRKINEITDTPTQYVMEKTYEPPNYESGKYKELWEKRIKERQQREDDEAEYKRWEFLPDYFKKELKKRKAEREVLGLNTSTDLSTYFPGELDGEVEMDVGEDEVDPQLEIPGEGK